MFSHPHVSDSSLHGQEAALMPGTQGERMVIFLFKTSAGIKGVLSESFSVMLYGDLKIQSSAESPTWYQD